MKIGDFNSVSSRPSLNDPFKPASQHLSVHQQIVHRLNEFIAKNQIPHIIFHGPSGSGKQTLVREFIQRIYSSDKIRMKTHVMTVNCSHGKGIQFIREELKFFAKANAQTKTTDGELDLTRGLFKVIVLLNAHHLTVDAQSALRRCIELFSYNTRFFIVVENKDKLLNPILSRFCDIFVPLPNVGNGSVNLHQYVLSQQFQDMDEKCREDTDARMQLLDSAFGESRGSSSSDLCVLMETVNRLYESGISCLDLMEWVQAKRDRWSEAEYSRAIMRFYQIKPQFRCEKLLMLFMMNYLYRGVSYL
jgi:Cdc6-like AAA superfamily ATPase